MMENPKPETKKDDLVYNCGMMFAVLSHVYNCLPPDLANDDSLISLNEAIQNPQGRLVHLVLKIEQTITSIERKPPASSLRTLLEDSMIKIHRFPVSLNPEGEGLFILGYYHQRKIIRDEK